jgi:hypothetical protein
MTVYETATRLRRLKNASRGAKKGLAGQNLGKSRPKKTILHHKKGSSHIKKGSRIKKRVPGISKRGPAS